MTDQGPKAPCEWASQPKVRRRALDLKTLLLVPLYPAQAVWGSVKKEQGFLPPMGLISVYNWLKHRGYDVSFLDTQFGGLTEDTFIAWLRERQFDVIGITTFTPTADYCFYTARLVKTALPKATLVFGNIHASSLPELTMQQCPECDLIIRHEGELTLDELLQTLAEDPPHDFSRIPGLVWRNGSEVIKNPTRPFIQDLDLLPKGFYGDLDLTRYVPHPTQYIRLPNYPLVLQRGCPYQCSFCQAALILGKKPRAYSPERVIEELKILKYEKGARGVYFQDSTLTMNRKYAERVFRLMIKEKLELVWSCNTRTDRVDPGLLALMYEAGCRQCFLGIESGNQQSLDVIRKQTTVEKQTQGVMWIHQAGIRVVNNFILCLPGETEEMVHNTIKYARQLAAQVSLFYLPVPYPGTELYNACLRDGGVREDARWSEYLSIDFDNPVYVNPRIGKERMKYWYKRAYIEYYSGPRVWWANLRAMRNVDDMHRFVRGVHAVSGLAAHGLGGFLRHFVPWPPRPAVTPEP